MTLYAEEKNILAERYLEKAREAIADAGAGVSPGLSINRSYYGMFYAAQAILLLNGVQAKTHEGVNNELARLFVKTGKISQELYKYMGQAESARYKADYYPDVEFSYEDSQKYLENAILFIEAVEKLMKNSVP